MKLFCSSCTKIFFLALMIAILPEILSAQDKLKQVLRGSNTKIIIEKPQDSSISQAQYMKLLKKLQDRAKNEQSKDTLLFGLKIQGRISRDEGIPFPVSKSSILSEGEDARDSYIVNNAPLSLCDDSVIIKRPGKDQKDQGVWLDTLYLAQNNLPKGKNTRDVYGRNVTVIVIGPDVSPYIHKTLRAEGARCLPFRHRIVGDADYKMFGEAALASR